MQMQRLSTAGAPFIPGLTSEPDFVPMLDRLATPTMTNFLGVLKTLSTASDLVDVAHGAFKADIPEMFKGLLGLSDEIQGFIASQEMPEQDLDTGLNAAPSPN